MKSKTLKALTILGVFVIGGFLFWNFLQPVEAKKAKQTAKVTNTEPTYTNDDSSTIYLNAVYLNTKSTEAQASRKSVESFSGKRMHLFKFNGPIQPEWHKMLTDSGLQIVDYIPNFSYLVYGDFESINKIQTKSQLAESTIEWDSEFLPEYRVNPDVFGKTEKGSVDKNLVAFNQFTIQLFRDSETNKATISLIKSLETSPIINQQSVLHYENITVGLSADGMKQISLRPDVISIHPYVEPIKMDERQDIIMTGQLTGNIPTPGNYLTYLATKGFTQAQFDASNFVVNVSDDGVDSGSTANVPDPTTHFSLFKSGDPSSTTRVAFNRKYGTASDADTEGCDGHGNLNAHVISGFVPDSLIGNASHSDTSSFRYNLGVAPFVKVGSSTIFTPTTFTNPNVVNLEAENYQSGGRISSNSWGAAVGGAYNTNAQTYDSLVRDSQPATASVPTAGNQEMVIVFSAGNSGAGANTIGAPGTGKNIISVGAAENVHAFGGADGCGTGDAEANSANDVVAFSSRGPTDDGRIKPDIQAPGTHITGGAYQLSSANPTSGTGTAATCFDAGGVCAGVGSNFFPSTQQWTTASSGTSHSAPAVAGATALIRQHFINSSLAPPSPAMTKAVIMSTSRYMNGVGANDNLYSNSQGMGMVHLNNYFEAMSLPKILRDQVAGDTFTASAQVRTYTGTIADTTKPVRVMLAYTDVPGPTSGNAYVNNLDLEVTRGGVFLGNVFTGGASSTGGTADVRNNTEAVILPAGTSGTIVIRVKATNIAGDGVPNTGGALDQDYALIVSNINEVPVASPSSSAQTITAESCGIGLVPDPGDLLTISLPLGNAGTLSTANLVATLQATGGVTSPSAAQNYGTIAPSAAEVTRTFQFTVNPALVCGNSLTLTWNLQDGATNYGTITKTFGTGSPVVNLTQNFDGVVAPALPAGWTQNQTSGTAINWVTSTTTPNSAPNVAFANGPGTVNATAIESPVFPVAVSNASLTFQKAFTNETDFDGVVLEIKIGAGAWTDIVTAGGVFVSGDYTGLIATTFGSPIGGRRAWTGASATFTPTVVTLPASTNGQNVQLRWLMASDSSVTSPGFRLDDVSVTAGVVCTSPCSATSKPRADFDGDGRTDLSVFRGSEGNWYLNRSTAGFTAVNWGLNSDTIMPGDFDGDGKADQAVYRPSNTAGVTDCYILRSMTNTFQGAEWGIVGDSPVISDFDADGKDDVAVYRSSANDFFVLQSSNGASRHFRWGTAGDIPVPADYDGDNRAEFAVFRPSNGTWYYQNSTNAAFVAVQWGTNGDTPVFADYDGDNKDDVAVYRPSNGTWYIRNSSIAPTIVQWGATGDIPVPGDYDGDGKYDQAVYRAGTWYLNRSLSGATASVFGTASDRPTLRAYLP